MVNRESALAAHYKTGHFGAESTGVSLTEVHDLKLQQVAAWADSLTTVADKIADAIGCESAPKPGRCVAGSQATLLRIEPLKWWVLGDVELPELTPEEGATLDLSHSRTCIRIEGDSAAELLNRHLPLDLREASFAEGAVASTAFHHVGVTLVRRHCGYELFLPRGFAVSLWELLVESAEQFGVEVV